MKAIQHILVLCSVSAWLVWIGSTMFHILGIPHDSYGWYMLGASVGIMGYPIARKITSWGHE